jgi:uncharacterized membrane protein
MTTTSDRMRSSTGDMGPAVPADPTTSRTTPTEASTRSFETPGEAPRAVPSLAALAGHPLHPMIVPLPIGAAVGALVADVLYVRTADPFWARSSRHLTDGAILTGALAASLGAVDFLGRPEIRQQPAAWVHAGGNAAVLGLALLGRRARRQDERRAVVPTGLTLSLLSGVILGVTGWLGGELSYRHRVGVIPTPGEQR